LPIKIEGISLKCRKEDLAFSLLMLLLPVVVLPAISLVDVAHAYEFHVVKYEWKWTLLIEAHSPKYGYTEGTATWSYKTTLVVGVYGSSSSISHGSTLFPSDGTCVARFRLCKWKYEMWDNPRIGTTRKYWTIVEKQEWYVNWNIHDGSTTTCSDDVESMTYCGYDSIVYAARYVSRDRTEDNPSSSWYCETVSASKGSLITVDIRITVAVKYGGVGVGVFKLQNTDSSTWIYKYYFGPHHYWYIDYLDSKHLVWAFQFRS